MDLEARLVALADGAHLGKAAEAFLSRIDYLLPAALMSTTEWAEKHRYLPDEANQPLKWRLAKTPYVGRIQDAGDTPGVRMVAVKANRRWGKTVGAENRACKNWSSGRPVNTLWMMQTEDDLADYVDERVTWMLENHTSINERIDWTDSKSGRFRQKIAGALALWRPATYKSTRGKAAAFIVADEIDAYQAKIADAIMTLIVNAQREFGNNAFAYISSHSDRGPTGGIDTIIAKSLKHLWHQLCPACELPSGFAPECEARMGWNLPKLLERSEEMQTLELLDMVKSEIALICPHCGHPITEAERQAISDAGDWCQPHQTLDKRGVLQGESKVAQTMGFIGHAFMSPFITLPELAVEYAGAKIEADTTQNDANLREVVVKSLGETYEGAKPEEQIEGWKIVKARLAAGYDQKTIPDGVLFRTAFIDVQGDRFEVRDFGWDLMKRSWLIDAYALKQWPGFDNIDPANRLSDWNIIEQAVLRQSYPIASTMITGPNGERVVGPDTLFLPLARVAVNNAGSPGVTNNGRIWLSNMLKANRVESYRVLLFQGSAHKNGELYGRPKQVMHDDQGKQLAVPIFERMPNVHNIKRMIALRMKIENGPGRMHTPFQLNDRYIRELTSEHLVNGDWVPTGRNETWDGWVAAELARATLQPDRPGLWDVLPDWATPLRRGERIAGEIAAPAESFYDRIHRYNQSIGGGQ